MGLQPLSPLTQFTPPKTQDLPSIPFSDRQLYCEKSTQSDFVVKYAISSKIEEVCSASRKPLHDFLTRMNQECNEEFRQALTKQEGYFYRFFSDESWEEWSQRQTPLGKVVSAILYDAEHLDANKLDALSCETLDQANAQAEDLLNRFSTQPSSDSSNFLEQLKMSFTAFDRFFPSINLIPGAQATSLPSDCAPSCEQPQGSYQSSCVNSTVTYLPEGLCSLKTYCASMLAAIPHQLNQLFFLPNTQLTLGNHNGTLTVIHDSSSPISTSAANEGFEQIFKESERVQKKLNDPATDPKEKEELEAEKGELKKREEKLLGLLPSGSVVTVVKEKDGQPKVVSAPEFDKKHPSFAPLRKLADSTGGIVGVSENSDNFPLVVDTVLDYILQNSPSDKSLDIAFVLDTTSSMNNDIDQVKANLVRYLEKMKESIPNGVRVALLEYRDAKDSFLNRIKTDFTADIDSVINRVQEIKTGGGDDVPEALYDALLAAQNNLSWNSGANRVVLAITDAQPHARTVDGLHDQQFVSNQYKEKNIDIAFYPIVTSMRA